MAQIPHILALETSCDETAAAICRGTGEVLSSVISSQIALHRPFGGVVPELASRNHLTSLRPVVEAALTEADLKVEELDAIAATAGPGLASSLLIGNTAAKGMALALDLPFLAINHLEGHLLSPFLGEAEFPPHVGLIVSGGHTLLIDVSPDGSYRSLGSTLDDAAGEAFDKVGKMLGLPYPGGPKVEKAARTGDPTAYDLPRSMLNRKNHDFSFSGLKTAVLYQHQKLNDEAREDWLPDLCASFQVAVIEVLVEKTIRAARSQGRELVTASGGVSCNARFRHHLKERCQEEGIALKIAPAAVTTDNAAMIGFAAAHRLARGEKGDALQTDVDPNLSLAVGS